MNNASVVFLDRDGVINQYPGHYKYVTSVSEFRLLPRVKEALSRLKAGGCRLFIVSNQAGVAKGLYSQETLDAITDRMKEELAPGIVFDAIFYCTHLPDAGCACRKPRLAFINAAREMLLNDGISIDPDKSFFVGDSVIDVETGKAAGLRTIMVFSGKETPENASVWPVKPDFAAADLFNAADIILR
jgi:histidinol-phosphate phosphatase family protein